MVCLNSEEKDHHEVELWPKDFPKGLKVLLLYDDANFATQTKIKLEQTDYVVSLYRNRNEALDAISENDESFHAAILEVTSDNCLDSFKFLESARNLPIIVASSDSSLNTMMKCISLGAAEFLQKPLSDEKLRNIWQHVVHKALNSGQVESTSITKSLQPIKEMVVSMLQLKRDENTEKAENEIHEKMATPSTPKLENKKSSFGSKEDSEEKTIARYAEKTCNDDSTVTPSINNRTEEMSMDEVSKSDECSSVKEKNQMSIMIVSKKKKNGSLLHGSKGYKKKTKVDWTPELHKKFVKAVEQLGIDQAIPSKILDLMKVEGLTRHNVASHLQKYRMHGRHISPKNEERRSWPIAQDHMNMRSYMQRPILTPYPPLFHHYYYSNVKVPSHPYATYPQYQPYPPFQPWQVPLHGNNWQCKSNSYNLVVEADTWGCPVFPPPNYGHYYPLPPRSGAAMCKQGYVTEHLNTSENSCLVDEEEIEKVVKEAMAEPWGPLPIGLSPPSTDSVLSELHRLGIRSIAPSFVPSSTTTTAAAAAVGSSSHSPVT